MENEDQLRIDNGEHYSHWNEECEHSTISVLCPADDWREPGVYRAEPSQAEGQHGRDYKRQESNEDRYCVKNMLPSFFLFQFLEVEWCANGKSGVADLYGDPNGQWIDNKTRHYT